MVLWLWAEQISLLPSPHEWERGGVTKHAGIAMTYTLLSAVREESPDLPRSRGAYS